MGNTDILKDMLDKLIDGNSEQAQTHFHTYLQGKMQEVLKTKPSSDKTNDSVGDAEE